MLLLSIPSDPVSNFPLLLFLIHRQAFLDIILELPALLGWQLIQLKFEDFAAISGETVLHEVNDPSLLLFSEQPDAILELVLLVYVHGLVRDRALLRRLYDVLNLALRSQVLRCVAAAALKCRLGLRCC